jgi:prepilin-type N-terminal cleavage/methylation domain-containing protein
MNRARVRGFTLIEVLVALAVLAVFATFAWRATASLVEGEARLAAEARRWQTLDAMYARIEADARAAVPRAVRVPGGRDTVEKVSRERSSAFAFTRAGGDPANRAPSGCAWRTGSTAAPRRSSTGRGSIGTGGEPVACRIADGIARLDGATPTTMASGHRCRRTGTGACRGRSSSPSRSPLARGSNVSSCCDERRRTAARVQRSDGRVRGTPLRDADGREGRDPRATATRCRAGGRDAHRGDRRCRRNDVGDGARWLSIAEGRQTTR